MLHAGILFTNGETVEFDCKKWGTSDSGMFTRFLIEGGETINIRTDLIAQVNVLPVIDYLKLGLKKKPSQKLHILQ